MTKHDVKARIEEFNALAGHEYVHLGMTSRDLTENVEQLQVRDAMALVRDRCVAALDRLPPGTPFTVSACATNPPIASATAWVSRPTTMR